MPMREIVPHTRRDRVANYGDTVTVHGAARIVIFDHTTEAGDQNLLTVECPEFFLPTGSPAGDFRPYVSVSWGHGATSVETLLDVTYRQRFAFVGSTCKVTAFIATFPLPSTPTAKAPAVPQGAIAKFRGFVCEGIDGVPLFATRWITQLGVAAGVFATKSARVASARLVAGVPGQFFQLFDRSTAPASGAIPFDMCVVDATGAGAIALGQTRGFVEGVAWGMSSTPFVFTPTASTVAAFAELEQ
jgi:hypothetical protein